MRISDWSSDVCSSDLPIAGDVLIVQVEERDRPRAQTPVGRQSPVEAPERARRLEIAIEASLGIQQPVGELGSPSLAASLPRQTKRAAPESDRLHHVATEAELPDRAFVGGEQCGIVADRLVEIGRASWRERVWREG